MVKFGELDDHSNLRHIVKLLKSINIDDNLLSVDNTVFAIVGQIGSKIGDRWLIERVDEFTAWIASIMTQQRTHKISEIVLGSYTLYYI